VKLAGRPFGFGVQLLAERLAAFAILAQSLLPLARRYVEPHQLPVGFLV
jgi:hypothetical protein